MYLKKTVSIVECFSAMVKKTKQKLFHTQTENVRLFISKTTESRKDHSGKKTRAF